MGKAIFLSDFNENSTPRDPFVFYHDGFFYHLFSMNEGLYLRRASEIEDLCKAKSTLVYHDDKFHEVWAPELHIIDGKCYIYVAMDDGDNYNHRMYVLENDSSDPLKPYHLHGQIVEKEDRWAIDGSILHYQGKMYFIWSGWEGKENIAQNIYIQEMSDPFTLVGQRTLISSPDLPWERLGGGGENKLPYINEGPYAIYGDKHIHIVYSGSGSWCNDYCLGLLSFSGGDILDKNNWVKYPTPILSKTKTAFGPGHASFFEDSRNGKKYFTYHLFNNDCRKGWNNTHAVIQEYKMVEDYPVLPKPFNFYQDK